MHAPAALRPSGLGSVVEVEDLFCGRRLSYRLVAPAEAALADGLLAIDSPAGRVLCGRQPGQVVTATLPRGHRRLRVLSVS